MTNQHQQIPEDVVTEILLRLPVKSLLRFCCVSKTWAALIHSPLFADMQLLNRANRNHKENHHRVFLIRCFDNHRYGQYDGDYRDDVVIQSDYPPSPDISEFHRDRASAYPDSDCNRDDQRDYGDDIFNTLDFLLPPEYDVCDESAKNRYTVSIAEILSCCDEDRGSLRTAAPGLKLPYLSRPDEFSNSCNGLVCIGGPRGKIYLCNPATRQFWTLPPSLSGRVYDYGFTISLGFGFDPCTKDYKLVKFVKYASRSGTSSTAVEIYKLRTNSWARVDNTDINPQAIISSLSFSPPVLLNGCLMHWLPEYNSDLGILSFNTCIEAFQKMQCPCHVPVCNLANLAVLDDSLAFVLIRREGRSIPEPSREFSIEIWVMMEYGIKESWIKKFSIRRVSLTGYPFRVGVLPCSWNNNILLLETERECLIAFSLQKNECQEIIELAQFEIVRERRVIVYEESLVTFAKIADGSSGRKM